MNLSLRPIFILGFSLALASCVSTAPRGQEMVMPETGRIRAVTSAGTIEVSAGPGLERSYTWDGGTSLVELDPRTTRWQGSLGAYYPRLRGRYRRAHRGMTRGVFEEAQLNFSSREKAERWIALQRKWAPTVYRNDGLLVSFSKNLRMRRISVGIWQILILGKKPVRLPGSSDIEIQFSVDPAPPRREESE